MAENLFINILEISITSAAAIAAILLISKLAENKFRRKWRYWVWVFLAFYLIFPVKADLPSAPIKMEIPPHEMIITSEEEEQISKEEQNGGMSTVVLPENPVEHEPEMVVPEEPFENEPVSTVPQVPEEPLSTEKHEEAPTSNEKKIYIFPVVYVAAITWITGAVIVCGWNIAMYLRFVTRSKPWNRKIRDEYVLELFEELKKEMGVPKKVQIYENRLIKSPMMVGFMNPRVLLPSEALLPKEYEYVLRHELTHYKRGDIGYKFLLMLAASVHWFNPMVGLMCRNAENDIEITCDEAAVKSMESDRRQEYCATILNIMRRGQNSPLLLSTSFYGGKKFLKSRFAAVLDPKTHRGVLLFLIAAMIILISGTMVACNAVEVQEKIPKTKEEIVAKAAELSEILVKNRDNIETSDYSDFLTAEAFKNVEAIVSASRDYIEYEYIDYNDYKIETSLNRTYESEEGLVVEMDAEIGYHLVQTKYQEVFNDYSDFKIELVKLVYSHDEEKFTKVVMYDGNGNTYNTARFRLDTSKNLALESLPVVTGPDENGEFPGIDDDIFDRYIFGRKTYAPIEKPEDSEIEPISKSLYFKNRLNDIYYPISDWKVVYEESFYVLQSDVYDPYTYSFRDEYVPYRFAILKTEQSNGFDTLFIYGYEEYDFRWENDYRIPYPTMSGGWFTVWEKALGDIDYTKIVNPRGIDSGDYWEPYEGKRLYLDFDGGFGGGAAFDFSIDIPKGSEIYYSFPMKATVRSDQIHPKLPEDVKNDMVIWMTGENPGAYYYDIESKNLELFENVNYEYHNSASGYTNVGFFDDENFYIADLDTIYFYSLASEKVTDCLGVLGGSGDGISEGHIRFWDVYLKSDQSKGGRGATIYSNFDGNYWICTFDFSGNILSNFSLGLSTEDNIMSYTYHNGLIYFSYGGSSSASVHYAVDTRPESDHVLQADAW